MMVERKNPVHGESVAGYRWIVNTGNTSPVMIRPGRPPRIGINLKVRISISTGKVIAGNLGTMTSVEYTGIGGAVNLGQRYGKQRPARRHPRFRQHPADDQGPVRFGNRQLVTVKAYNEPVECHEVTG